MKRAIAGHCPNVTTVIHIIPHLLSTDRYPPAMPRPAPPEKLINTAVRLPASTHRDLHEAAGARDISVNRLVVRAVEQYLKTLRPVEDAFLQRHQ